MEQILKTDEVEFGCPACGHPIKVVIEKVNDPGGRPLMVTTEDECQAMRILGIRA